MRKKNFLFIVAMVFILMLSGCGKSSTSEPITTTKFKTIMEEKGLEVTDKMPCLCSKYSRKICQITLLAPVFNIFAKQIQF